MSVFDAIKKAKADNDVVLMESTIGGVMAELMESYDELQTAGDDLLVMTDELETFVEALDTTDILLDELDSDGMTDAFIKAVKLTDRNGTFAEITGVDFSKVTDENRDVMGEVATEGLKEGWQTVVRKVKEIIQGIKDILRRFWNGLFDSVTKQTKALKGLKEKVSETPDEEKIEKKTVKCYAKADFDAVAAALKQIGKDILGSAGKTVDEDDIKGLIMSSTKDWNTVGFKEEDGKLVKSDDGKKLEKKTCKDLGFNGDAIGKAVDTALNTLDEVNKIRSVEKKMEGELSALIKKCDALDKKEDKNEFEKVKKGQKNVAMFNRAAVMYGGKVKEFAGAAIALGGAFVKK